VRALIIVVMQAESLEVLEKAEVAPAQARAIVRAIEIEIAGAKDTLATKHDLVLLRQDVRNESVALGSEFATLRTEFGTLRTEFGTLRGEFAELRIELKGDVVKLEGKIHESASSITRQMYMAVLGQMAVLLGFAYFFATHVR
jgi:hypothetical protein